MTKKVFFALQPEDLPVFLAQWPHSTDLVAQQLILHKALCTRAFAWEGSSLENRQSSEDGTCRSFAEFDCVKDL